MQTETSNRYATFRLNGLLLGFLALLAIVVAIVIPETRSTGFYVVVILLATTTAFNLAVSSLAGDEQKLELGSAGARAVIVALGCLAAAGVVAAILWSPWAILLTVSAAWDLALLKMLARADSIRAERESNPDAVSSP